MKVSPEFTLRVHAFVATHGLCTEPIYAPTFALWLFLRVIVRGRGGHAEGLSLSRQNRQILRPELTTPGRHASTTLLSVDAVVANVTTGSGTQLLDEAGIAQQRIGGLPGQHLALAAHILAVSLELIHGGFQRRDAFQEAHRIGNRLAVTATIGMLLFCFQCRYYFRQPPFDG